MSVYWVNRYQRHARQPTFVFKKLAQLEKRPAMQCRSLRLASLYPSADAGQFLDGNSLAGAFSLFDNAFADVVICPGGKTLLFARQFLETAARGLRAFALQLGTQLAMAKAHVVHGPGRVDFARAINGDVCHAEVNAQKAVNVRRIGRFNFTSGKQVKLAVDQAQVRLATLSLQQFQLPLSCQEGDSQATINRPNAYLLRGKEPAQDTRIVGNTALWLKGALGLTVKFVGVGNLADCAYNYLSRKASRLPNGIVGQLVEAKLIERLVLPSNLANLIARRVGSFQCGEQRDVLIWRWLQFDFRRQFHALSIAYHQMFDKLRASPDSCPSPRLKPGVSRRF